MEVELRIKILGQIDINKVLDENGYEYINTQHQIDKYYKPEGKEQEKEEVGSKILRIRTTNESVICTIKTTIADGVWDEKEVISDNLPSIAKLILDSDYKQVIEIDKVRNTYKKENYTLNIDKITGLGTYIEIEILTADNIENAQNLIRSEIIKLFGNQTIIENRGYVKMMKEKLKNTK